MSFLTLLQKMYEAERNFAMTLVVLAAGMGSRYGGLKQIDPVGPNGEFIIDYSIYDAVKAGFDKVVFVIKRENYDVFRETIGVRLEHAITVEYAFQEVSDEQALLLPADRVKPLGTAHALLCAKPYVNGPFAVINSDDYYGAEAYRLAADYLTAANKDNDNHFCMVGYRLANTLTENGTVSRGICVSDEEGYLRSVTERTKIRKNGEADAEYLDGEDWVFLSGDSIASMNFFGFTEKIFDYAEKGLAAFLRDPKTDLMKGEYYLPTVASQSISDGSCDLKILPTKDLWFGVTYKEDRPSVVECFKKLTEAGVYPKEGLWRL